MAKRNSLYSPIVILASALVLTPAALAQQGDGALTPTPSTGTGPEFTENAPFSATLWREGDPGERLMLTGRVIDVNGGPITGAVVHIWQADGGGSYHPDAYRGKVSTDETGNYAFRTAVPGNQWGVAHIHMQVTHDGFDTVSTRVEFKGDPALSQWSSDHAIVLEETNLDDFVVFVGEFDVVMTAR